MFSPRPIAVFVVWVAAYLLSYFYRSANAVIAGDLRAELGLDAEQLGFMTSLFFLSFALVQLPLGGALDRFGSRRVVPFLLGIGAVGSVIFGTGEGFYALAVGRALLGVGFAGVLMGATKSFAAWFPPHRFATVSGLLVGIGSAGALVAGTPLALLAGAFGWRVVFVAGAWVVVLAGTAVLLVSRDAPPDSKDRRAVTDDGPDHPAAPAGGTRALLADHRFWRISFANLALIGSVLAVQGLWGGPYLSDVYGLDPVAVGNLLVALGVGVVFGNLATGWLADTVGRRLTVAVSGGLAVAANAFLAVAPAAPPWVLAIVYAVLGYSGAFIAVLLAHVREVVTPAALGRAMTAVNFFGIGGAMLLQWLMGAIVESAAGGGRYDAAAYRGAFLLTGSLALVATLLYLPAARRASGRHSPTDVTGKGSPGSRPRSS